MKDSKEYSPKITKLFRALKQNGRKPQMPTYPDPVQAVVDGLVYEFMMQSAAERILKRMKSHFVDLNDLRVSRKEEILDVFKDASEDTEKCAAAMTGVLNALFEKNNKVTLDYLKQEGKRQAKKELEEISGMTAFAANYCFLTALDGHAIPLTAPMLAYLRDNQLVHPEADEPEIAGFLERQITASDAYAFYVFLRDEVESGGKKKNDAAETSASAAKPVRKKAGKKK